MSILFKKIWPIYYNCKEDLKNEFYQLTRLLSEKNEYWFKKFLNYIFNFVISSQNCFFK